MDDGERGMDPLLSEELVERLAPLRSAIHHPRSAVLPLVGSGLSRGLPSWVGLLKRLLKRVDGDARAAIEKAYGRLDERNASLLDIASAIADEIGIETIRTEIANVNDRGSLLELPTRSNPGAQAGVLAPARLLGGPRVPSPRSRAEAEVL